MEGKKKKGRDNTPHWLQENYSLAGTCAAAVLDEDLVQLGACLTDYWRIKRTLAPGAEPDLVRRIFLALEPFSLGGTLAGAGGGGFLVAILKVSLEKRKCKYIFFQSGP